MSKFLYNLYNSGWLLLLICVIAACQTKVEKPANISLNKYSDSILIQIYDYQDKRDTKNLLSYFNHENSDYRKAAAEAFGSVQDSLAIPMLSHLLYDSSSQVRRAAAYALGQSYDSSAVLHLTRALQGEDSVFVRKELLEALGKVVTQPQIQLLYHHPVPTTKEKEGMAWGLYRAAIRNVHDGAAIRLGVSLLDGSNSYEARLGAAHLLARGKNLDLKRYQNSLITAATQDISPLVRMAVATALRNIPTEKTRNTLAKLAGKDLDYRVRVNALRSLTAFDFEKINSVVFESLNDTNINVAITAAGIIEAKASNKDQDLITENALKAHSLKIKTMLLGTALKLADDKAPLVDSIKQMYNGSHNSYFKADLLSALGNALISYEFLITQTYSEKHPAITTAGISALAKLRSTESFPEELEPAFTDVFKQAIESEDIAMITITSDLLTNPEFNLKEAYDSVDFLYEAKSRLSLPKDNEAIQSLNKAIAYFEGTIAKEVINEYNHPIDWELVKSLSKDQKVVVETERGNIELRLMVEESPGSVSNFVALAQKGYFNGKNFHRVVPNFVVQGGCNRGDGYGGEDYSIRSELANLRYTEGTIGMASAGKDTEGTQWFITHSPTPHLDGRYTIFAQVTDGMDVVHQLQVGDTIQSVNLKN
ncbi:peptidylprolyl isomerase [Fulvivirga sp. 29W222]|uniref:peptidylprolyl isomerase n=1 Tax=Fulvivirga marina TaxID=2494733 RepID=A0A937FXB9_9BACT|nr:peptidylprolyl isomerase [Fulvivirga marina]MBL6446136.1 peptidylprolyl isomerase [Fulvivirga marina]